MKKIISALLALVLCLSLCACGGGNNTPETTEATEPSIVKFAVGETASTEVIEFTLDSVEFADHLSLTPGDEYLTPIAADASGGLIPNEGKIFVCFSFTVKNIGKVELDSTAYRTMNLVYSDGYTFEVDLSNNAVRTDNDIYLYRQWTGVLSLDVLSDAQTYRVYVQVPEEVMKNTAEPLDLVISLQKDEDDVGLVSDLYTEFVFDLRG